MNNIGICQFFTWVHNRDRTKNYENPNRTLTKYTFKITLMAFNCNEKPPDVSSSVIWTWKQLWRLTIVFIIFCDK